MFVKRVSMEYIIENEGSWSGGYDNKDKWIYYWIGDFKTGREVKVSALDHLRYRIQKLELENNELQHAICNLQDELVARRR